MPFNQTAFETDRTTSTEMAALLREKRISSGYSLDEMSLVTGLTASEIADVERGIISRSADLARLVGAARKLRR
ncbi:XRE family transcriptional regulator [Rhizobium vallis]|uniref:XRE family transcriptional regulator n=2 Tax=Rhizobium vallis TaxID=634290 RepID=A0A432PJ81_9HYPH|nr:XRE family transcriptional regulator [Rhizobium vallis]